MSSIPSCSAIPISVTAPIYVFRHPAAENQKEKIFFEALELNNKTTYSRHVPLVEAPTKTDCVTAACYIAIKAFGANFCPAIYEVNSIRGIPASMTLCGWYVQPITSLQEIKAGDMLFLLRTASKINHMAVCLNASMVFHSNRDDKTGVLETYERLFGKYNPIRDPKDLATNEDTDISSEAESAASSADNNTRKGLPRSQSVDSMFYHEEDLATSVRRSLSPVASSPSISVDLSEVEQRMVRSASRLRLRRTSDSTFSIGQSMLNSEIGGSTALSPERVKNEKLRAETSPPTPYHASRRLPSRSASLGPSPLSKLLTDLHLTGDEIGEEKADQKDKG